MEHKLAYSFQEPKEAFEACYYVVQTLDRGINESGVNHFHFPPDPHAVTELNEHNLEVQFRVKHLDGTDLGEEDEVFLTPGSLQSLYATCQVRINGNELPPNNVYSYGATLVSYVTTDRIVRKDLWQPLSGWKAPKCPSSKVEESGILFKLDCTKVAGSKLVVLKGKVMSDFLNSCTQALPMGMSLDVVLRRGPDNFALCSKSGQAYKIVMEQVSLAFKRAKPAESLAKEIRSKFSQGGAFRYNRLATAVMGISAQLGGFRWNNVFNRAALPHTIYMVLVKQAAFYGNTSLLGNYFESAGVSNVRFMLNGRDVLAKPYRSSFEYSGEGELVNTTTSYALDPFMGLSNVLKNISQVKGSVAVPYEEFLQGSTIWATHLNSCGGTQMAEGGFLDVEISFDTIPQEPYMAIIFGEYNRVVPFDANGNIQRETTISRT